MDDAAELGGAGVAQDRLGVVVGVADVADDRLAHAVRELDEGELEGRRADLAASYQRAIVRALVARVREAAKQSGRDRVAIVGGVAANSELRAALPEAAAAPLALCTDNAAMIASAARWADPIPYPRYLSLDAYSSR